MAKVTLFDQPFDNFDFHDLLLYMDRAVRGRSPSYIVTCNVDHLVRLQKDGQFRKAYAGAGAIVADGMPIVWASRLLGKPLKQRVAGSDLFNELGAELEERQYRMFFLGAAEGVAAQARRKLLERFPRLQIVGAFSPSYGFESNEVESRHIVAMIRACKPDIVWVGVGAPKQEKWIHRYHRLYEAPLSIGVGAAFDFIAGNVKRAPPLVRRAGLEWAWRLGQEPRRLWRRYLVEDMQFAGMLLKQLLMKRGARHEANSVWPEPRQRHHSDL